MSSKRLEKQRKNLADIEREIDYNFVDLRRGCTRFFYTPPITEDE